MVAGVEEVAAAGSHDDRYGGLGDVPLVPESRATFFELGGINLFFRVVP